MACDTSTLLDDARCFQCAVPPGLAGYVSLAIMCRIIDGDTMACDPSTLLDEARCLQCEIPQGMLAYVQLAALCNISGGGGGGGGQLLEYTGPDPTTDGLTPTDPTQPAMAYSRDGSGSLWSWNTNLQIWN